MARNERGRAYRRHQYARLKQKRIRDAYWGVGTWRTDSKWSAGMLGVAVNTPTPHSDPYCRGPHRQERRADAAKRDEE